MKYIRVMLLILIFAIIIGCSSTNDYPIAKVGKRYFYKSQFKRIFTGVKATDDINVWKEKANIILENTMKQMAILEMGLLDNDLREIILKSYNKSMNSSLVQLVYKDLVTKNENVSETEVFEKYKRLNTTFWAQHILVDNKKLADSIYTVLKKEPHKFGILAKKHSLDTNTKDNEGKMKPFPGDKFVIEFESACLNQKQGVIGKPVESTFGYHIIIVNRREFKTLENYDKDKKALKSKMIADKRKGLEQESMAYLGKLINWKPYKENIKMFLEGTDDKELDINPDSLDWAIRKLPLIHSAIGTWTYDSLYKYTKEYEFGFIPNTNEEAFNNYMDRIMFFLSLYNRGERMGGHLNNEIKKEIYLKLAITSEQELAKEIRKGTNPNDSTLNIFYTDFSEKFMEKGRVGIFIISNPDSNVIKIVADSLKISNKPFEEFSRIYSTLKPKEFAKPAYYRKTEDDTLGYYERGIMLGEIGMISGIFKNSYGYNIIKVMEISKPKMKEFDKIKNQIKNEYIRYTIALKVDEEFEKAKNLIGVEIYEKNFEKMIKEIFNNR